jgi:hypothetical protein
MTEEKASFTIEKSALIMKVIELGLTIFDLSKSPLLDERYKNHLTLALHNLNDFVADAHKEAAAYIKSLQEKKNSL